MDKKLVLYGYFRSSAAYRVRIVLGLKKLACEYMPVSLLKREHKSEHFLAQNPQGMLPMLMDGEYVYTQSLAICEYLEEAYPTELTLLPDNAQDRAWVRSVCQLIACDIHPVNNLRILNYLKNELAQEESVRNTWYQHWIVEGFDALEIILQKRSGLYCLGDTLSLADVCLVPQVYNALRFKVDLSKYPTIVSIVERLEQLPAFIDAHPDNQKDAI